MQKFALHHLHKWFKGEMEYASRGTAGYTVVQIIPN